MSARKRARPALSLTGLDGDDSALLDRCVGAAQRSGWTPEQIAAFVAEATSADYERLLRIVYKRFKVAPPVIEYTLTYPDDEGDER